MNDKNERFGIAETAAHLGLEPDTLRYFEREGPVPPPQRNSAGHRRYTADDIELIGMLVHLRKTGMPLSEISRFTGARATDTDTARLRLELLEAHRRRVEGHRDELDRSLEVIRRKIADYGDPPQAVEWLR